MFLTLLKKQLLEINWTFFVDRKTNKVKPKGKVISSIALFVVLMLFVAASLTTFTASIIITSIEIGADWFGFVLSGIFALVFGVFGSVFNTYGMLYKSKDNELLASLPIEAKDVLLSRICSAFAMSLLYTSLVMIPAIILYQIFAGFNLWILIASLLMHLVQSILVTVITCALGYVVALISSHIKNKSFVTVIGTVVFLVAYYAFIFKLEDALLNMIQNLESITASVSRIYALYVMGTSYTGNPVSMLIFTAVTVALFALTLYIMSKNFFRIANIKDVKSDKKFEAKQIRTSSIQGTLIKKELSLIVNTPVYLLNSGLGIVFMIFAAGFVLIKGSLVTDQLQMLLMIDPGLYLAILEVLPALVIVVAGLLIAMDSFTASSISLEGKNLWQLQCLPVDYKEVIHAKALTSVLLNGIPSALLALCAAIAFKFDVQSIAIAVIGTLVLAYFFAYLGLTANILSPNFTWTNATSVVKQSMAVTVSLFGGWIIIVLLIAAGYLAIFKLNLLSALNFTLGAITVVYVLAFLLKRFCERKGTQLLRGE